MSVYISILVIVSMAFVLNNHLVLECRAVQIAADLEGVPMTAKRSFCNTYGGCRSKKTTIVPPVYSDGASYPAATGQQQQERRRLANSIDRSEQSNASRRDTSSALVAEILSDLVEYLQADEKYRQGKYVVMVPKHYDGIVARSSDPGATANNRDEQPPEMQELQVSRLFGRVRNE